MKTKLETISPDRAREMLKQNTHNRTVIARHRDYLASEMTNGRWITTPAPISISPEGLIVDGQHRLLALVQSGMTFDFYVCRDVPMEVQPVTDGNSPRSLAQQMQLLGLDNAKQTIPALRALVSICCYNSTPKVGTGFAQVMLAEFGKEIAFCIKNLKAFKPGMKAWVIGALALAYSGDRSLGAFIEMLGSGENLKNGDPAKVARDWLTNARAESLRANYKKKAIEQLMNCAYNFVEGIAYSGSKNSFPKPGSQGLDYFAAKKRKVVVMVREQMRQQLAKSPAAAAVEKKSEQSVAA